MIEFTPVFVPSCVSLSHFHLEAGSLSTFAIYASFSLLLIDGIAIFLSSVRSRFSIVFAF